MTSWLDSVSLSYRIRIRSVGPKAARSSCETISDVVGVYSDSASRVQFSGC